MTTAGQGQRERQRVLEVCERGPQPAERAAAPPRHPQLLRDGAELDRLDAVGNEVGPARDRGEAEVLAAELREAGEAGSHVGLVAGALPAEHVGVDDDEQRHATASS